jgi:UDP-GlcNAc3NAcA epimerase
MSKVFFDELGLNTPDIEFDCGGGTHAEQTAKIMLACEGQFIQAQPDAVLVYGDTNSTLAAAICAYKMNIPVFHVEAGLRSFNLRMPEECNRIATDHLSTLLFCPTEKAVQELGKEGLYTHDGPASLLRPGIISCGDVMYDNSIHFASQVSSNRSEEDILLATCHRPSNTDDPIVFEAILNVLAEIGKNVAPVVMPLHPRVMMHSEVIDRYRLSESLRLIEPVSYLTMIKLIKQSKAVITDSGGLQKESFFLKRPCVVMRDETEWTELVENGNAMLAGNKPAAIQKALQKLLASAHSYPSFYGEADAAHRICDSILKYASTC